MITSFNAFRLDRKYHRQLAWIRKIKVAGACSVDAFNCTGWFHSSRQLSTLWKDGQEDQVLECYSIACLLHFDEEIAFIGDSYVRNEYYYLY